MLSIEEAKLRILSELQEAGEENVAAMANTIFDPSGDRQQIATLRQALEELVQGGLIRMSFRTSLTEKLVQLPEDRSLVVVRELDSGIIFRDSDRHWTWVSENYPHIVATDAGLVRADDILEEHGYQWWRQRK